MKTKTQISFAALQGWVLKASICALSAVALSYCGLVLLAFLAKSGTTFKEVDAAAWVQAVGSVLGIAAGAGAIWWQTTYQLNTAARLAAEADFRVVNEGDQLLWLAMAHVNALAEYATLDLVYRTKIEERAGQVRAEHVAELLVKTNVAKLPDVGLKVAFTSAAQLFTEALELKDRARHHLAGGTLITDVVRAHQEKYASIAAAIHEDAMFFRRWRDGLISKWGIPRNPLD